MAACLGQRLMMQAPQAVLVLGVAAVMVEGARQRAMALAVMLEVRPAAVLAAMAVVMAVVMPVVEASTTRASMITYRNLMTTCRTMT